MKYHIKWTHNSAGVAYGHPICNSHSNNINYCHQVLGSTLALYSLAKGEVEECNNKDCNEIN